MDGLRLARLTGAPPMAVPHGHHHAPAQVCAVAHRGGGGAVEAGPVVARQSYMLPVPLRRLWPGGEGKGAGRNDAAAAAAATTTAPAEEEEKTAPSLPLETADSVVTRRSGNWVVNILRVKSLCGEEGEAEKLVVEKKEQEEEMDMELGDRCVACGGGEKSEECDVGGDDEKNVAFDRESFSRLLQRVSLVEAQLYEKMSHLGSLAYSVQSIKPGNLLNKYGLHFVTSSFEKKAKSMNVEEGQIPPAPWIEGVDKVEEGGNESDEEHEFSPSAAYEIAASAAAYLQSRNTSIHPLRPSKMERSLEGASENDDTIESVSSDEASFVASTNSLTAVVAGKEEMKQAVTKDLNSANPSPCEWFVCDDNCSSTRYFVIQGSETLASWQANLLFEPIQFEGLDVLVHRGIYEAAKGIYEQMLPEVQAHLKSHGNSATLRFTGHSLGGSLSLLINLMLLIRGVAPSSSLLPVITFGAPSMLCGGDYLLRKLGLPQSHVQAITMHRDIVPRAFSCHYPDHVAKILKALNGNFRNHPCLKNQKLLYAPVGKFLILQPDEKFSPNHHLLPPGSGLYLLGHPSLDSNSPPKQLEAAKFAFLNSPHPLEILSDRGAYGSKGTVYRDHDVNSYLKCMHGVLRQELNLIRKAKREQRRRVWWPLVASQGVQVAVMTGQRAASTNRPIENHHFIFSGVFKGGKEKLKRFGRLVASQHVHMLLVFFIPAHWFVVGALAVVHMTMS